MATRCPSICRIYIGQPQLSASYDAHTQPYIFLCLRYLMRELSRFKFVTLICTSSCGSVYSTDYGVVSSLAELTEAAGDRVN